MDSLSYYKELKALVLPDSKLIDEINREILIAKDKKDREELSRLKAKKIYFKVIDPFLKTHQYIMSMRPHYFADIDKEISQMQVDPTAVIKDPVEIFDFLEKQDNPIDVLKVFCSASDYLSLSNAFYNSNREIAKQEFIALVSDKAKNVDVTKLSYYCAYISFFKEEMWNNENDQIRDAIVSMSFGDECSSRLKELYECITPFYEDPSYKNFVNLYGAYFTNLLMTIFLLEHKPFSVEKKLLIGIFYNEDDPDCISIYRDYLEFIFNIDIWEKIPEERKQIILQLPLAEEVFPGMENGDEQIPQSKYSLPIDKFDRRNRTGEINKDYIGLSEKFEKQGVEKFTNLLNAIAQAGYINNDKDTIQTLCYRLSGYNKPAGELKTIEFHYINKDNDKSKEIKWPVKNIMYLIGAVTESKRLKNTGTNRYVIGLSYFNYEGKDNMPQKINYQGQRNAEKAFKDIVDKYTK